MTGPFLSVKASGLGGRGYRNPFDAEAPVVPSVTTVLGAIAVPGIIQWTADQTALYAVANADRLLDISEERGYAYLRWYHSRTPKVDSPDIDIHNYHSGVLNDLAELGTWAHSFAEAHIQEWFEPEPENELHRQMANAIRLWVADNDIEVLNTEATVFGNGYAGTFDMIARINGVITLVDFKTSAAIRESHIAQLGALGAAHSMAVETTEDDPDGVPYTRDRKGEEKRTKWFRAEPLPPFTQYAVIQIRPDGASNDGEYIPAFCQMHIIDHAKIDTGFEMFKGALQIKQAQKRLDQLEKAAA